MSGVATLKLRGAKRHFDEMAVDLPVPPQACSPGRYPLRPPPLKRGRCIAPSPISTPIRSSSNHINSSSLSSPNKNLFNQLQNTSIVNSSSSYPSLLITPTKSNNNNTPLNRTLIVTNINNNSSQQQQQHHHHPSTSPSSPSPANSIQPSSSQQIQSSSSSSSPPTAVSRPSEQQQQQHNSNKQALNDQQQEQELNNSSNNINNNDSKSPSSVVVSSEDLAALARHLPRRLKRVIERLASGQVQNAEKLFTLADLHEIVNSVIHEHDAKLKDQFTVTLNERLAEQFRDFTKFNEDYVSRQLRGTDVAYLS